MDFNQIDWNDPKFMGLLQMGAGILAANNGRQPGGAAIGQGLMAGGQHMSELLAQKQRLDALKSEDDRRTQEFEWNKELHQQQLDLQKQKALHPGIADEYGMAPRIGIHPETGKPQYVQFGKNGKPMWTGIQPTQDEIKIMQGQYEGYIPPNYPQGQPQANGQSPYNVVLAPGTSPQEAQQVRDFAAQDFAKNGSALPSGLSPKKQQDVNAQIAVENAKSKIDASKPPPGYRWQDPNKTSVVPITGGPADQKLEISDQGRKSVSGVVSSFNDIYNQLDKGAGITNPDYKWGSNIGRAISSSDMGQAVGGMIGTENQSLRNKIAMERPKLLQAIMKATGMSAKQMDSNAELKLWLSTATDPKLDIKSNLDALKNIEETYGLTGKLSPNSNTNDAAPQSTRSRDDILRQYGVKK